MSDNAKYKQIFIAYASKDEAAYEDFMSHLNLLKRKHDIKIWSEAKINPGVNFEEETKTQLQKTNMIILLVSPDLFQNRIYKSIHEKNDTIQKRSITVVPVLLRACKWKNDAFLKDWQSLPRNGQFIKLADDEDAAYLEITQEIEKMIVGEADSIPTARPVSKSTGCRFTLILAVLVGLWWTSNFFNEKKAPIFGEDTALLKILIIRFEDNLNEEDDTYCIGRSIEENFIQLKENGLPIYSVYADSIASPKYSEEAEHIQQRHNADVLIYGLANEIQENCAVANVCFRHVVADTIMTNLITSDDIKRIAIKHDTEYEKMNHGDIEKGKLSIDEQSMENWITGLVALKKDDKEIYFVEIEKMTTDIAYLSKEEQALKFYNQAEIYCHSGHFEKAIESLTNAIEVKPDYAEAYNNRGYVYEDLKDYKKAILDFNKAIELKSDYVYAYNNRGHSLNELKDYDKAVLDLDKAIELKPDYASAYNNRGISHTGLKKYNKAILDLDKATELKPNFAEAYNNRGVVYENLENYNKAISEYDKAIELKPDFADAYNNRGVVYGNLGNYNKAILEYDKAIELKPDFAMAYRNRGIVYSRLNDHEKAILDFDKAIELKPDYIEAYFKRGVSYNSLNNHKKAVLDYDKMIELMPNNANAYDNRIYTLLKLNRTDDAKKDIITFQKLRPENNWVYLNWSMYYTVQKDFPKAIENLQKAIDLKFKDKGFLQKEELFDPLRNHPEFKRILESMGN